MELGLILGHIVLDGHPVYTSPKKGTAQLPVKLPNFRPHVYCGQTAGWIKMPLSTVVGLGPGDVVLDGDVHSSP